MEREFPPPRRTGLQACPLMGLLAHLELADRPAAPPSFVEGLGRWLGWKEAITLSAVLQPTSGAAAPARAPAGKPTVQPPVKPTFAALAREFNRVQQDLRHAVEDNKPTAREDGHSFLPFRRRCFNLQQAMDTAIRPLRTQLRAAVASLSPAQAQLAALDAAMASVMAPREHAQLAQMPVLLEKHFTRLRTTAQATQTTPNTNTPWLTRFRHDMQQLLLAELDLRLQPAQGLLATLQQAQQGPERRHD